MCFGEIRRPSMETGGAAIAVGEATTFEHKEYDVTDHCAQLFCWLTCPLLDVQFTAPQTDRNE